MRHASIVILALAMLVGLYFYGSPQYRKLNGVSEDRLWTPLVRRGRPKVGF